MVLMKEPLSHKSEILMCLSLAGGTALGVHTALIGLGQPKWKDQLPDVLVPCPTVKVCWFSRFLNVSTLSEIKDKMNLDNISGSKQKLLALGRTAWYRLMKSL